MWRTLAAPTGEPGRSRDNPVKASFLSRRLVNKPGSEKETWYIEFDLSQAGLDYVVGDSFGVFAANDLGLVDQIIAMLGASHMTETQSPPSCACSSMRTRGGEWFVASMSGTPHGDARGLRLWRRLATTAAGRHGESMVGPTASTCHANACHKIRACSSAAVATVTVKAMK